VALKQARVAVHGYGVVDPAALIERRVPLMVFARSRQMLANSLEVLSWLREQGAHCLVVSVPSRQAALPPEIPGLTGGE
jgi:hypothetical protein